MKIVACGGRKYDNQELVHRILGILQPTHLIEGGAPGADRLARNWCTTSKWALNWCMHVRVDANWSLYGAAAGPIRNVKMLEMGPDLVLAFPGGKGTENCINQARSRSIPVLRVEE